MRSGVIPFQFDLSDVLTRLSRKARGSIGDVTRNFPFVSIAVKPRDRERQIARELVIRLRDRRVLSAWECCDGCIDRALASLQEIRRTLVDRQVELADAQDGPLFLTVEAMVSAIRQFLTFEQSLKVAQAVPPDGGGEFWRQESARQAYFDGLELLRGHLSRCLAQVAAIAGMDAPTDGIIANYQGSWPLDAYKPVAALPGARNIENG